MSDHQITMVVRDKIPVLAGERYIVCHNEDYELILDLDAEWDAYDTVTVLFHMPRGGGTVTVLSEGRKCAVPACTEQGIMRVGITAGNVLRTSTPAEITVLRSARNDADEDAVTMPPDITQQIIERQDELEKKIDGMTPGGGGTGGITQDDLEAAVNEALDKAAASGAFDGQDGVTPHIGTNGNWYIGSNDTGVKAAGVTVAHVEEGKTSSGVQFTTITLTDGTTFTIYDGARGTNGTSVTVSSVAESDASGGENVVTFSDGKRLVVKNGKDGKTPVKGVDYYTDADKSDMVQAVIAALPVYNGEVVWS